MEVGEKDLVRDSDLKGGELMKTDIQPINLSEREGVCVYECVCVSGTSINPVMNAQAEPHRCLSAPFCSTYPQSWLCVWVSVT